MKVLKVLLSFLLILTFVLNKVHAQETKVIDKFSIGLNFGSLLHYGDIKQYDWYPLPEERKWGGGAVINYQISPVVSLQAQGLMGNLAGVKRTFRSANGSFDGQPANLKFDAEIYEGSFNATISLTRWWAPHLKCNEWLNVYGIAGIGLVKFRTQLRDLNDDKFINSFGWSDQGTVKEKMTTETVMPFGLGVKVKVHEKIDINLETTLRNVNTDKLDAFIRTNNSMDKYGYTSIGVIYRFGKQDKHMEWLEQKELDKGQDMLALDNVNKKIDEVSKKVDELESKISAPTETQEPLDLEKLAELNNKLNELDERNKELNNKISNIQTSTVTQTVVTSDGVTRPVVISVFFEVNKSTIDKINAERVAAAAKMLLADPNIKMELVGHADKTGGQRYNELLSERRAKAVYDSLIKDYGINASRLSISSKGYADPLSKNNFDVNRRVDFVIK